MNHPPSLVAEVIYGCSLRQIAPYCKKLTTDRPCNLGPCPEPPASPSMTDDSKYNTMDCQ